MIIKSIILSKCQKYPAISINGVMSTLYRKIYVSPKKSFRVLRFVGIILRVWPVNDKKWNYRTDIFFWFCIINCALLWVPLCNALYLNHKNVVTAAISWIEVSWFAEITFVLIYSKYKKLQLYVLLSQVERCVYLRKTNIIKQYATIYAMIFFSVMLFYLLAFFVYMSIERPNTGYNTLITTAVYPFDINSYVAKAILYCNQIFLLTYAAIAPTFDGISVLLLFVCTHRINILDHNFRLAKTLSDLAQCIREHDDILYTIKETNSIVRILAFKTVCSFMSNVIPAGLEILNSVGLSQSILQICTILLVYTRIVLCSESAGNMTNAAEDLVFTIYSSLWYDEEPKIVLTKTFILQKCQNIPAIHINGLMSGLDRKYLLANYYTNHDNSLIEKVVLKNKEIKAWNVKTALYKSASVMACVWVYRVIVRSLHYWEFKVAMRYYRQLRELKNMASIKSLLTLVLLFIARRTYQRARVPIEVDVQEGETDDPSVDDSENEDAGPSPKRARIEDLRAVHSPGRISLRGVGSDKAIATASRKVNLQIRNDFESFKMKNVLVIDSLALPPQRVSKEMVEHYQIKTGIVTRAYDASPMLLIGQENCSLILTREHREINSDVYVVFRCILGWSIHGFPNKPSKIRQINVVGNSIRALCISENFWLPSLLTFKHANQV
ncbi:hypothetical protein TSAR_003961 [Trichomalopsis sarcophagae]|uniref:Odorant receptor n=1 Tax=Trichomalopsis sarcophagae TaxID=543379 RepID=A0A232ESK2_9HYME|nr:hypothetical protein TSAR_003961 [Trichomalopsis sarcophagae]